MPSTTTSTTSNTFFASIALLAAAISTPLWAGGAGESERGQRNQRQHTADKRITDMFDHNMQVVNHETAPDAPAYGWRYFSDEVGRRAVVISPQGDYYYSRGKGLHWVAAEQI